MDTEIDGVYLDTQKFISRSVPGEVLSTCILVGLDSVKITPLHNHFKDTSNDPFHFQKRACYKVVLML